MPPLQRITLPGPLTVWAPNEMDARVLYREIVAQKTYEKNGIAIPEGGTVFDVGANIGLFSLHLMQTVPRIRVHAFEPVPDIYDALQLNLREHAPAARSYSFGLADRPGEAVFVFDRFASMASTMHTDVFERGADKAASGRQWASAALSDFDKMNPGKLPVRLAQRWLETGGLREAILLIMAAGYLALRLRSRLFLRRRNCKLKTLSGALADTGADSIDLVKIDVEGSEEAVLDGIADKDWNRLRQLVIEVHDIDGRLQRMSDTLEHHGFHVIREREDWALHELLGIWTLYAIR